MKLTVLILVLSFSASAFAANCRDVTLKSGDETVAAYLCAPAGGGRHPGLVAIQEWWGLVDWVKEQTQKLADAGYVVIAPDLYRGKSASTPEVAHELMRGMPHDRATRDLVAAASFLRTQSNVQSASVGAIGWCMGGGLALEFAVADPKLRVAVVNYGSMPTDPAAVKKIGANVLGIFGAKDQGIPVTSVRKFEQDMKQQGKKVEMHVYPEAGHGFQNPNNKAGYRAQDTADSWSKTLAFLKQNLI